MHRINKWFTVEHGIDNQQELILLEDVEVVKITSTYMERAWYHVCLFLFRSGHKITVNLTDEGLDALKRAIGVTNDPS